MNDLLLQGGWSSEKLAHWLKRNSSKAFLIAFMMSIVFLCGYLQAGSYSIRGTLLASAALLSVSYFAFRNLRDSRLLWSALFLKILAAFVYVWIVIVSYHGVADMMGYHKNGLNIAESLRHLQVPDVKFRPASGFISYVAGLLHIILGPSVYGVSLIFSWIAFGGICLFRKAFRILFPDADHKLYSYLIFFFPSVVLWSSLLGKNALILFFLGLVAYSFALLHTTIGIRAVLYLLMGLAGVVMTRPQTGVVTAISIASSIAMSRGTKGISKLLILVLVLIASYSAVRYSISSLGLEEHMSSAGNILYYLETKTGHFHQGGSAFQASPILSLKQLPMGVVNSLLRPFPWEVPNFLALIASSDSILLLALAVRYFKNIIAALTSFGSNGFIIFIIIFSVLFTILLSTVGNFGILVRQRVQLMPFLLMFIAYRKQEIYCQESQECAEGNQ